MSDFVKAFRSKQRVTITLPVSGLTVNVRKLLVGDFVFAEKNLPSLFQLLAGKMEAAQAKALSQDMGEVMKHQAFYVSRCASGTDFRFVDKEPEACGENELSVYELDAEDCQEIALKVFELSGMPVTDEARKEAARVATSFPSEPRVAVNT